jgi:hypothetical protein
LAEWSATDGAGLQLRIALNPSFDALGFKVDSRSGRFEVFLVLFDARMVKVDAWSINL